MYHNIGLEHEFNTLSIPHFIEHLEYLKSSRYKLVSLSEYVENLKSGVYDDQTITMTFDDAYVSICDTVLPSLKEVQIPFTVFVPVNFIEQHNKWDVEEGPNISKIMSWGQLEQIAGEELVTIGSHGMSHTSFGELDEEAIDSELKESKAVLEERLQTSVNHFSYPYGQYKDLGVRTDKKLEQQGYDAGLSTLWGKRNTIDDVYKLKRIEIQVGDSARELKMKMEGSMLVRQIKQNLKTWLYKSGLRK